MKSKGGAPKAEERPWPVISETTERKSLSQALHDGLCQDLMGATLIAQVMEDRLVREQHPMAEESAHLRSILRRAADEVQSLYRSLQS